MSNYTVGSVWKLGFGNGWKIDTIVEVVDNFRVKMASGSIVQKSWLRKYWWKMVGVN